MLVCGVNEEVEWVAGGEFHAIEHHTPLTDLLVTYDTLTYTQSLPTAATVIRAQPCHPRAEGNALNSTAQALP